MNHFDVYFATCQGKGRTQCFQEHGHPCDEMFHSIIGSLKDMIDLERFNNISDINMKETSSKYIFVDSCKNAKI